MSTAETAYLFRHALLREAAYQLQLPSNRARLHELAFMLIEGLAGGRAPEPLPLTTVPPVRSRPHTGDAFAAELAEHARLACFPDDAASVHRLYRRRAAEHADRTYQLDESSASWRILADLLDGPEKGEALFRAAQAAWLVGKPRVAEPLLDQAVEIHRKAGTRRFEGLALANLAALYLQTGRDAQAERNFEAALVIFRAVGDRRSEANGMGSLAGLYATTERYEQAERLLEPALAIFREIGERRSEGMALENLASVYKLTDRAGKSEETYAMSLAIHREIGNRRSEGITQGSLAELLLRIGRFEEAERHFEQALAIHREVKNLRFEGHLLCDISRLDLERGRTVEAGARWLQGAEILARLGDTGSLKARVRSMTAACAKAGVPPFGPIPG